METTTLDKIKNWVGKHPVLVGAVLGGVAATAAHVLMQRPNNEIEGEPTLEIEGDTE